MKKIVIFGISQTAELALYYLKSDSQAEVAGFAVSEHHIKEQSFEGLPIFAFEDLEKTHSPSDFSLFAPMMASGVNHRRREIFDAGKGKGFEFFSYVSSKATVLTSAIGENCFILEDNTIQPFVSIEDNCVIWSGNHIGHHSTIQHSAFITSHCVISGNCMVGAYAYMGVNSSLKENTNLAEGTMVTMASTVSSSKTHPYCVVSGNPGSVHEKLSSKRLLK